MKWRRLSLLVGVAATGLLGPTIAVAQPYTAEQAIAGFHQAVRSALGFDAPGSSDRFWLSLSLVGPVASASDRPLINDLANFCPLPTPVIQTYARVRRLDAIYQRVLQGLTGPLRPETDDFRRARAVISSPTGDETPQYQAYRRFQREYGEAFNAFVAATDPTQRRSHQQRLADIRERWPVFGFQNEVDGAFAVMDRANHTFSLPRIRQRTNILNAWRDFGIQSNDPVAGSYRSPASELSPAVESWTDENGWVKIDYDHNQTRSRATNDYVQRSGFGGLSLGFLTIGGTGGGGSGGSSSVSTAYTYSYTFQIRRVIIRRPWLDTEVFYQPTGWTWMRHPGSASYPRVAENSSLSNPPADPASRIYDNQEVACPLLPLEFIVARNRSITATVSNSAYEEMTRSSSSNVGGSLFGLFGGRRETVTTQVVNRTSENTTFKMDAPGVVIIGIISERLPTLPDPNLLDSWSNDAWLPPPR